MAKKRQAPLVRPKSMFPSAAKAWQSIAKQSGLKPSQVTAKHTAKAYVWKRKATAKAAPKKRKASRAAPTGKSPKNAPKKQGAKKNMANSKQTFVEPEAVGLGAIAGALGSVVSRFLPPEMSAIGEGATLAATGAMAPKGPAGARTKSALQTFGGVAVGDGLAEFIPVPRLMGGGNGGNGGNGNGNRQFL